MATSHAIQRDSQQRDIDVEEAIVEAEFRDNRVITKYAEQLAKTKTSQVFRQVAVLSTLIELHMDQGYHNKALAGYLDREITPQNLVAMRVAAILKAREEAKAEMITVAAIESQAEQDEWWESHIAMKLTHTDWLDPIAIIKLNQLIAPWKRHVMIEMQSISVIQHVRMLKKVVQYIMEKKTKEKHQLSSRSVLEQSKRTQKSRG